MEHSWQKLSKNIQNHEEEEDEDANARSTCGICTEPISANNQFKNRDSCAHSFCKDCIAKYIEFKVEDHGGKIECPELNCQQVLDPLCCRSIISQSAFSKWCDVLCDNYILGFERNYCPNGNCRELVVNECGGKVMKSTCPNCKELFCFQCKLGWHAGYGCEESRNMREPNDILFGQLFERKLGFDHRCPTCRHGIERIDGCSFIICRYLTSHLRQLN